MIFKGFDKDSLISVGGNMVFGITVEIFVFWEVGDIVNLFYISLIVVVGWELEMSDGKVIGFFFF